MRVGLALSQYGAFAGRDAVIEVARGAEDRGFHSLWTGDRILDPVNPRDRYPGSSRSDGRMPRAYRTFMDPLTTLTAAAAVTSSVRLGTSTLNATWYSPVLLARTLSSLDVLSGGRLDVGLGVGWSRDEYEAAGVPWQGRGARLEETLDVLEAIWSDGTVAHKGPLFSVPESHIEPKPLQRPRPPIYLGGYSDAALERIGRRADGWVAPGAPLPIMRPLWDTVRRAAETAGRDPDRLRMIVRMNPRVTETPGDPDALPIAGTIEQLAGYARSITGADEVFVDLQQTMEDVGRMLDVAERFRAAVADQD